MKSLVARPYTANPCYPPSGRAVASGWHHLATSVHAGVSVVAVDGPVIAGWADLVAGLGKAFEQVGRKATFRPTGTWLLPWRRVQELTSSYELRDDPDFDFLATGRLADLVRRPSHLEVPTDELCVVYGPGAALVPHDLLWYADLPKRYAESAVSVGTGAQPGSADWVGRGHNEAPLLYRLASARPSPRRDRSRDRLLDRHARPRGAGHA